jgi:aminoglycoside 2'-N-acetyltransferase I
LLDSFPRGVTEADFINALGGMHAVVWDEGDELVAHASVVPRRMLHQGRSIRTGYVEAVAVASHRRREHLGSQVMDAIEQVISGGYELGALSASTDGQLLYANRAWLPWSGTTSVMSPRGIRRTPDDDDSVQVLPVSVSLDFEGDLACDWRDGDVW